MGQVKQKVRKKLKTSLSVRKVVLRSLADCGLALFSFSTTIAISNHHHHCVRQRLYGTAAAAPPPLLPTRLATIANTSFSSSSSYTSFPFRFSVSLGPRPSLIQSNESRSSIRRTRHRYPVRLDLSGYFFSSTILWLSRTIRQ